MKKRHQATCQVSEGVDGRDLHHIWHSTAHESIKLSDLGLIVISYRDHELGTKLR